MIVEANDGEEQWWCDDGGNCQLVSARAGNF